MKSRWLLFPALLFLVISSQVQAGENPSQIWLVMDRLNPSELLEASTPVIDSLQKTGAFSLMNVRTAGHLSSESTYLSAGAGKRCQGSKNTHTGYNSGEGWVYNDEIKKIINLNQETKYQARIGNLGYQARLLGIRVGVLGNTDIKGGTRRTIVSLAMDEKGIVPRGDVSRNLLNRVEKLWGYETNWKKMQQRFLELKNEVDLLFIETGDLSRIEAYRDEISQEEYKEAKYKALEEIDSYLEFILDHIQIKDTAIGILVPTPPKKAITQGDRLGWILLAGKGIERGWLYSSSTRQKGLITITDFLPLVLSPYMGSSQKGVRGDYFSITNEDLGWRDLIRKKEHITLISNLRPYYIKGFIFVQLLLIFLAVYKIYKPSFIISKVFEYILLALFLVPINYLLVSKLSSPFTILGTLLGMTGIELVLLFTLVQDRLVRLLVITITLDLLLIIVLFTGYHLMADSLLGYSSIIGARYYGIGNEYMGLFCGSLLVSLSGLLELIKSRRKFWRIVVVLIYLTGVVLTGASNLGANFGGMITLLGAGVICYIYYRKRINVPLLLGAVFILFFLILLDYKEVFGPSSHIGQSFGKLLAGEWHVISTIIQRKIAMNLKLLRWTIWTRILLAFMAYLIFLFWHPNEILKELFRKKPYLATGFYGGLGGSVITIFVNDSGVVAAATILFYPMLTLLYFLNKY